MKRLIYDDYDDVRRLVDKIYEEGDAYTYDFETLGSQVAKLKPTGLGFAWGTQPDQGAYILLLHDSHPYLEWQKVLEILKPLLEDDSMTQIAHNQLFDATILDYHGVKLHTNTYDTMVMAWLLNTDTPNGLKHLVKMRYDHQMAELTEFCAKEKVSWHPGQIIRLDQAPIDKLNDYAIDDVIWTYRLWEDAMEAIRSMPDVDKVYHDLYQEYLLILSQMMSDGVRVDLSWLQAREIEADQIIKDLFDRMVELRPGQDFDVDPSDWTYNDIDVQRKQIDELNEKWKKGRTNGIREKLYDRPDLAHKVFNPNSGIDINKVLFEELGLEPIGEKNKKGLYSVDAEAMVKLLPYDDTGFVKTLMQFTSWMKLQGTYHVGLQELIDVDGRVRTSFRPTVKTGRLSSSQPNLQNIPARTEAGKEIRKAFVPREGFKMLVADYSQAELRIAAHISQDQTMIDGFLEGADPHSITAYAVFGDQMDCGLLEVKEKYPEFRAIGKTLNFALLYGAGPAKVANSITEATGGTLAPTVEDAKGYKEAVLGRMPGIGEMVEYMEHMAQREGYVETLIGRRRHLPDAQQKGDLGKFYGALRRAVNSPIQGSAGDIIAIAKRNMRRDFIERGWWRRDVFLVLQVHDELVFEVREDLAEEVEPLVKHHMEHAVTLDVPMIAEPSIGLSWFETK